MNEIKTGIFTVDNNNDIFVCGDIHGDYQCLIHCLVDLSQSCEITKIFNDTEFNTPNREYLSWITGNNSIIIFCGDLIHRKRYQDNVLDDECSDIFIIKTLLRLKKEAKENGGDIIIIAGNHEILNILYSENTTYTSNKNLDSNDEYFNDPVFISEYISNSYAWIKINDILLAHGGLCSDYLRYLDEHHVLKKKIYQHEKNNKKTNKNQYLIGGKYMEDGDDIIEFVNDKYRYYFSNLNKKELEKDIISEDLFIKEVIGNKHRSNMFWCREWGYSGIDCVKFKDLLNKVGCKKMIIAHCPQFISPDYPKMINFECIDINKKDVSYNIARVDVGMSRSFDYNKSDNFFNYLSFNYNRKMSILKLLFDSSTNEIIFNTNSVITMKLSCIQYLLIKYGLTKEKWLEHGIDSNWLGFEHILKVIDNKSVDNQNNFISGGNRGNRGNRSLIQLNEIDKEQTILTLLEPVLNDNLHLNSKNQFRKFKV